MRGERRAVMTIGLAGAIGTFLPWIHVPALGDFLGAAGPGKLALAAFALAVMVAFESRSREGLDSRRRLLVRSMGLIAIAVAVWARIDPEAFAPGITPEDAGPAIAGPERASVLSCDGLGWFVALGAGSILTLGPWMLLSLCHSLWRPRTRSSDRS